MVEIVLHTKDRKKSARITAAVVDDIMTIHLKDSNSFEQVTQLSVSAINKEPEYKSVKKDDFQQVLGGQIQILIGQNLGQNFFPEEIATLDCGLKISRHQIELYDENRCLGFSGIFPTRFSPMYNEIEHPRALAIQERPQQADHEGEQVFQVNASAALLRDNTYFPRLRL